MMFQDDICAPATPSGGAIAIVRMSGPECIIKAERFLRTGKYIHSSNAGNCDQNETSGNAIISAASSETTVEPFFQGIPSGQVRHGYVIDIAHPGDSVETASSASHQIDDGVFQVNESVPHIKDSTIQAENDDKERIVDEVVAVACRAPHTYTGEDTVEIYCHGSQYIVSQILELCYKNGLRLAGPGEFTQRAFLNGKMDLAQAEAVADVIQASSKMAHDIALNQLRGGFSKELEQMRSQMLEMAALMELELDFSDQEVEFADREKLSAMLAQAIEHCKRLASSFKRGNAIKNGIPVAIVGRPNSGKSTLLNALVGEERAIVSDIPGTTRDTIEERIDINGLTFRFVDTAGIRETTEIIEREGINRAKDAVSKAQIVLAVIDPIPHPESIEDDIKELADLVGENSGKSLYILLNKCDKSNNSKAGQVSISGYDIRQISAKTGAGIEELKSGLAADYLKEIKENSSTTLVTNQRHAEALANAVASLERTKSGVEDGVPSDLVAQDLREAIDILGTITGAISSQDVLNQIFAKHCIGK